MENSSAKKSTPPPARQMVMSPPHPSDNLFIGGKDGRLSQVSIRQKKVIKHYGKIMPDNILALKTTANKKILFVGDQRGN